MEFPKISIITPSFNQAKYIEQTIRSVLDQNYPNLEYIIVDGGSTDGSIEIIKKFEKELKYWVSEPDQGQSDAINKAMPFVSGDIVNWLNSDDYLEPGALFKLADLYNSNQGKDVFIFKQRVFFQDPNEGEDRYSSTPFEGPLESLLTLLHIDQPSTFFKTFVFKELMPLNCNFHYVMDAELWARYLLSHGNARLISSPEILVNFRMHSGSKTTNFQKRFFKEKKTLLINILRTLFPSSEQIKVLSDEMLQKEIVFPNTRWELILHPGLDEIQLRRNSIEILMFDMVSLSEKRIFRSLILQTFGPGLFLRKNAFYLWLKSFFR